MSAHNNRVVCNDSGEPSRSDRPRSIRQQQQLAGHEPCYATDKRHGCREYECLWRGDCVKLIAAWLR
ncbi:MAG: hypothetical protein KAS48_06525 [Gammaproteobacteria bacterium]|nr:hypothetical protein [Gammaproteobacteria bacterium]MCK5092635.1 hypothetical protein [Gammaproteobacteria bacterium]